MTEAGRITAIIDGDISQLTAKLAQARSQATTAVSGIESDFKGKLGSGLSGSLSGGDFGKAGKKIGGALVDGVTSSFGPLGSAVGEAATALGPAGLVATAAVAGAVIIGSAASGAAMEWEAGMSQISKTTSIRKGTDDFKTLNSELKNLYATMPTTVAGIQGVASAAGSLGIERTSIAGFTEVALQMGSAFDMPAEEAAVAMGKIKSQLKSLPAGVSDSTTFAKQMGSAIDFVGNSYNATEKDVLDFATRTSGSLSALGGNAYEIAGWGGMLASVFPSAERAAGSFDSLLTQLTTNTDSQAAASELLGVSTDEFMTSMSTDPSETLLNIGSALEGLPTDKLMSVTKDLGGAYGMDTLTKMVGHTEEWRQAIDDTVAAGQKGESIGQSFADGADNAKSSLQILKNSVGAILTDMGGPINDVLDPLMETAAAGLNGIREIGENLWEPFTTAISPATTAVSLLASGVAKLAGIQLAGLVAASKAINTAFQVGKAFVSAFAEELYSIVEGSETFQTLKGYVEDLEGAFDSLKAKAGEVWDSVVSGLTEAIPTAISGAASAVGSLFDQAGLSGVTDAASGVGDFLGDVYDNAAKKLGWGVEKGTQEGMEAGSEKAKSKVESDLKDAASTALGDGFIQAVKDSKISSALASVVFNAAGERQMSDTAGLSILDSQAHTSDFIKPGDQRDIATLLGSYSAQHFSGESLVSSGYWNIFDGSGKVVAEKVLDLSAWKSKMKPIVLSLEKYFETSGNSIENTLRSAIEDGIIDPTNETPVLEGLLKQLDEFEAYDKVAFEASASNLPELRAEIQDSLNGIEVDLQIDTGSLETNFSLWLEEQAGLYAQEAKYNISPDRDTERGWHDYLNSLQEEADSGNQDAVRELELIGKWQAKLVDGDAKMLGSTVDIRNEIEDIDPEITKMSSYQNMIALTDALIFNQLGAVGNNIVDLKDTNAQGFADEVRLLEIIAAKGLGNITYNSWTSTPSTAPAGGFHEWDYMVATPGTAKKGVARPSNKTIMDALAGATYGQGGVTSSDGLAYLHENELVTPLDGLAMSSGLQGWGFKTHNAQSGTVIQGRDPNAAQWTDCVQGSCALTRETDDLVATKQLQTCDAVATKQLQTGEDWLNEYESSGEQFFTYIKSSAGEITQANTKLANTIEKVGTIDIGRLGYNQDTEKFFYQPPAGYDNKEVQMGRVPKAVYKEYQAATAEIERMNEELDKAKENYLSCWDIASDYTRWLWQPEQQASLFQGDFIGSKSNYGAWVAGGKTGNVGFSAHDDILSGFSENEAGRLFRENNDVSAFVSASKFGTVATQKNTAELSDLSGWIPATTKTLGAAIDRNTNAVKASTYTFGSLGSAVTKNFESNLITGGSASKSGAWRLSEFDTWVASAESGLNSCIESLSDFAIYQEGVLGPGGAFRESYMGLTSGWDKENGGALEGYTGPNFQDFMPDWGAFSSEASRRWSEQSSNENTVNSQLSKISGQSTATAQNTAATKVSTENTKSATEKVVDNTAVLINLDQASMAGYGLNPSNLTLQYLGYGGGSNITGFANRGGGTYWGGTSISGGGASIGGGSTMVGGRGYVGWGGTAVSNQVSSSGGHGMIQLAEGGIVDEATYGIFGEAGREAFIPISDRAAGLKILPRVLQELGVRKFAKGGLVGRAASFSSAGGQAFSSPPNLVVNVYPSQGMDENALAKKVVAEVALKMNGGGF